MRIILLLNVSFNTDQNVHTHKDTCVQGLFLSEWENEKRTISEAYESWFWTKLMVYFYFLFEYNLFSSFKILTNRIFSSLYIEFLTFWSSPCQPLQSNISNQLSITIKQRNLEVSALCFSKCRFHQIIFIINFIFNISH